MYVPTATVKQTALASMKQLFYFSARVSGQTPDCFQRICFSTTFPTGAAQCESTGLGAVTKGRTLLQASKGQELSVLCYHQLLTLSITSSLFPETSAFKLTRN